MQFYIIDCDIKTITNAAESKQTVKFTPKCIAISVEKSAFWNINTTNEIRGYWVNKNDIKTFLTFDNDENLVVSIFFSCLHFYFMKKRNSEDFKGKVFIFDRRYLPWPISGQCSPFIPPTNTTKTKSFLFSGSIKWKHWSEMF